MDKYIIILVRGREIKFYPKGTLKYGFYYEMPDGMGFYTKDLFGIWGKPSKTNAVKVAESYIESMPSRVEKFDNYKK